jgi:hypothetical protein
MALFDELPNLFLTQKPEYLQGLLGAEKYKKLEQQSNISGLLNTFVNFVAQPKNQGYGSIIPYAARSYLAGTSGAQNVYDTRTKNVLDALNVAKTTKQIEMEGMTELDKLIYNRKRLQETDPTSPYLSAYDAAIGSKSGGYGSSVEGVSYNILLRGNDGSADSVARRQSPQYAVAYREVFEPKTVMQTVQDPVTGITKQIPVQIKPAPPPPNILPPIYGYDGTAKPTATTTTPTPTTTADAGNITSAPTALTPTLFKEYDTKVNEANLFNTSLETLKNDIKQNGLQIGGLGAAGFRQQTLYEDALTKLRIADQLGVLNKEDLPRLQKKLPPPDQISTFIKGGGSIDALIGAIEAVQESNNSGINYYTNKMYPKQTKPAGTGGGLMLDLEAISNELKKRKGK